MSNKKSKRLVIDTDVAKASGSKTATHPRAKNCRDFLLAVRKLNYSVVMSEEIRKEWTYRPSRFSRQWLVAMEKRKKVCDIDSPPNSPPKNEKLRTRISSTGGKKKDSRTMDKDFRLLQAALATDQTVISLDETVRGLFKRASQQVGEIRDIIWVNPDRTTEEQPITWLQNGAPPEAHRRLST